MISRVVRLLLLSFIFSGCIRLVGKAGYYHQGSDDEAPQVKEAGFDTAKVFSSSKSTGSIEIAEKK